MDTERPRGASSEASSEVPAGVPARAAQSTGDPRVDEAVAGLDRLRELPLDEHPAVLESVHDKLREILGELGDAGARPAEPEARQGR